MTILYDISRHLSLVVNHLVDLSYDAVDGGNHLILQYWAERIGHWQRADAFGNCLQFAEAIFDGNR